jgi:hypothetical protein
VITGGKYRFSLQWAADSEERILVGNLLERFGNRKSELVVAALSDYAHAHPGLLSAHAFKLEVSRTFTREQIESMVRAAIAARLSELELGAGGDALPTQNPTAEPNPNLSAMLANLDLFFTP